MFELMLTTFCKFAFSKTLLIVRSIHSNWNSTICSRYRPNRNKSCTLYQPNSYYFLQFNDDTAALAGRIMKNAKRYQDVVSEAVDALIPSPTVEIGYEDDVLDVIIHQRTQRDEARAAATPTGMAVDPAAQKKGNFPAELTRRYCVWISPPTVGVQGMIA